MKVRAILVIVALSLITSPVLASAQEDARAVVPEGRMAVLSGRITNIDPDDMTIEHMGEEITVQTGTLTHGGTGDMNDFFDEGMYVTIEGVMEDEDEIVASRVTRGRYYDTLPFIEDSRPIIMPQPPQ